MIVVHRVNILESEPRASMKTKSGMNIRLFGKELNVFIINKYLS